MMKKGIAGLMSTIIIILAILFTGRTGFAQSTLSREDILVQLKPLRKTVENGHIQFKSHYLTPANPTGGEGTKARDWNFGADFYFSKDKILTYELRANKEKQYKKYNYVNLTEGIEEHYDLLGNMDAVNRYPLANNQNFEYKLLFFWMEGLSDLFEGNNPYTVASEKSDILISLNIPETLKNKYLFLEKAEFLFSSTDKSFKEVRFYRFDKLVMSLEIKEYSLLNGVKYPSHILIKESVNDNQAYKTVEMKATKAEFNLPESQLVLSLPLNLGKTNVTDYRFNPEVYYVTKPEGDLSQAEIQAKVQQAINDHVMRNVAQVPASEPVKSNNSLINIILKVSSALLILLVVIWVFMKIRRK